MDNLLENTTESSKDTIRFRNGLTVTTISYHPNNTEPLLIMIGGSAVTLDTEQATLLRTWINRILPVDTNS
jgi:hypothetical protein